MSRPCSGCVHGRLYVTRQQEHSYVLSPPAGIHSNSSAGAPMRDHSVPLYKMIPVSPDLLSVGGGTLHTISARFGTHSPARAISGEAEPECYPLTDFVG